MSADFGLARAVAAQSFGEPGQRTFRLLLLGSQSQSASLWLEKEHLRALVLAIRQVLSQVGEPGAAAASDPRDFPEPSDHDFRVGTIGIGYDPSDRTMVLQIGELETGREAALEARLSLEQSGTLAGQLEEIIIAGRPICALCRLPIESTGHVCVRSNGHTGLPIPEADEPDGSGGEEEE